MDLMFLGAAREVTGSRYLLRTLGKNILIDCGMEQGGDTYENQELPVSAQAVDCVVLTHAHIDHSGMLPKLYADGFRGSIFATPATAALCDIMLRDSAHIQEQEAEWRNRKAQRSGEQPYQPIYTTEDAEGTLNLFVPVSYGRPQQILDHVSLTFSDAGHLLGSASATLDVTEEGQSRAVVFSGDIGNLHQPILNDPHYLTRADYVVMESTYGDRVHGERPDYIADLVDVLQTTFDRGGNVVIPSFAVGRTQELLYFLREIKQQNLVRGHEGFPVYMDSPLAIKATGIFNTSAENNFDEEMKALLQSGANPLSFEDLKLGVTADESKAINFEKRPCVIISASGMAEAGRIRHHLKHNLWRPNATILFVGYQSVGTLGRALLDGAKTVRLFNEDVEVHAQIRTLRAISGHADADGLQVWAESFQPKPTRYFVCHGEEGVAETFAQRLTAAGLTPTVPYNGDGWDLLRDRQSEAGSRILVTKKERKAARKAQRKQTEADSALQSAFDRLRNVVEGAQGYSNSLKRKLAEQINKLINKWQ
ncbi:MAG: MBL fold metallo-hydrolase [Clostridiales bacterium]|nr:MBL fold metallo-hydrolase [Clostridiales bacterium]